MVDVSAGEWKVRIGGQQVDLLQQLPSEHESTSEGLTSAGRSLIVVRGGGGNSLGGSGG